ncbi:MAG: synthase, partial [Sphaerisporangium sp.]|nr:synthase [Sphaerisporangium sp.]
MAKRPPTPCVGVAVPYCSSMDVNPTDAAMRRSLARARDGKALDVSEATVLLHARGADLER